jgi:hypothetical protein
MNGNLIVVDLQLILNYVGRLDDLFILCISYIDLIYYLLIFICINYYSARQS